MQHRMVKLSQYTPQGSGGVEVYVHSFFIMEMDVSNQLYSPVALPTRKCFSVSSQHETGRIRELIWILCSKEKSVTPSENQTTISLLLSPYLSQYMDNTISCPLFGILRRFSFFP